VPTEVAFLAPFVSAGVFGELEVHLAHAIGRRAAGTAPGVLLAVAVAARGLRFGHVCVELGGIAESVGVDDLPADALKLPWPDPELWRSELEGAPSVVGSPGDAGGTFRPPLVWDGERLYLHRYWSYEVAVASSLRRRARLYGEQASPPTTRSTPFCPSSATEGVAEEGQKGSDAQGRAVEVALRSHLSVIAGGPGTGKTTTIASLLSALSLGAEGRSGEPLRIALAAPTGKAAARMTEALGPTIEALPDSIRVEPATTVHRLLGWAPGTEFVHHAGSPLDADVVIVDETSMVDLSLMAHLLDAVPHDARLVLVGDPHQLASVEAGTVLGDIVAAASDPGSPLAPCLSVLTRQHRFGGDSPIAELAGAIREGDADLAMGVLSNGSDGVGHSEGDGSLRQSVGWVRPADVGGVELVREHLARHGARVVEAARAGEAELALEAASRVKLLAAVRQGAAGLYAWSDHIEASVAELVGAEAATLHRAERWYVGKPVLVTANDPVLGVANGDVGVVVSGPDGRVVAMHLGGEQRRVPPGRLDDVEPWWAMTIHKSQGSEFPEVVVSLPPAGSPVLTRELLYTAVTRARSSVTLVAEESAIRAAIESPVQRSSGLVGRLISP
jgi:exodeoxyribonuclease V alpha subunit